jgi:N-acetylmuramoyl-L-alanine amidase
MSLHQLHIKFKNTAFVVCFAILCLQTSSAWAGKSRSAEDLYYLAQKSYYKFKGSTDKQQFRHNWEKVIQQFSKVVEHHPKSPQAYKAVYTMARLYQGLNGVSKNSKDLEQALHYYKKVSRDFSKGTLTDDALFESAEIYLGKKDFSSAAGILKTIFEKYPNGDQANKARLEYQKLASTSLVLKNAPQPAKNNQPVVLSKKKKPEPKFVKQTVLKKSAKLPALAKEKKTEPVVAKQVLATSPKGPKKEKIISKPKLASQEKKAVKPVSKKKRVVARKTNPSAQASVKKAYFKKSKKGKKGHLYTPSSGSDKKSATLIVVDAGHGGKDQGAKSAGGLHEKSVNLTIARHVRTILVNRFKYRVVMTRKDDTFIPLKERSEIANNRNADLFVSIHANAAKRKSAHGIETYFLGTTHNDDALAVAARENGELVHSVKDGQVQEILASLITTTKINDSSRLAGTVQENLFRSTRKKFRALKNLGVKEGPFYVLHGADMPSILVEVGFLTNRKESRMLSKPDYLYRLASSIAEGIHKYLQEKGPSI